MTINVYPSITPCEAIESHEHEGTFTEWLDSLEIDYRAWEQQPIALIVNELEVPYEKWSTLQLKSTDNVQVRPLPNGGVFKAVGGIIGKVFNLAFGWLLPKNKGGGRYDTPQGRKLEAASAVANIAKLGEAVPELAGRFRRFPEYLTPPRRYFASPREQMLEFLACVGPGHYQINDTDVKVGDTPISSLGKDGAYQLFKPGVDLSGISTHEHWYTVSEVGGTSSGSAGLELSTEIVNRENKQPTTYTFTANTIIRSEGVYPSGWGNGTIVNVEYPQWYEVKIVTVPATVMELSYQINEITGYFGHLVLKLNGGIKLGTLDNLKSLKVSGLVSNDDGTHTIRLHDMEGKPVNDIPLSANQSFIFGADVGREIINLSDSSITVSPAGFKAESTASARVISKGGSIYGEWTSEFVVTPSNETTDSLEVDFFLPNGLSYIEDNGEVSERSVSIEFQYRDLSSGTRVIVQRVYTGRTTDQIGFTERIIIPRCRVACRARRVGAQSTSTQAQDKIHWLGLKCRLPTKTSYSNWTTISVKLRSGGKIAAQSENKINLIATRILPTLQSNGTWGAPQATRDISAFVRYIAHSIGYTDADIDMVELQRLHNTWKERGDTVDHVFDLTTVKSALSLVLAAGMSELTIANGLIRPVRDEPRSQFEAGYSPHNMTKPLRRSFKSRRHDDADGVEVEYIDAESWTQQTVICSLPGSQRLKLEKLSLKGVTDRTRAWRIGMRRARQIKYQNWEYGFETEMDALNSEYLSYVPLIDDMPGYGQSALLTHIESVGSNVILTVSEPIAWEEGQSHVVAYRKADGTLAGPWTAMRGIDEYSIIALIPVAQRPVVSLKMELPHVYIGTTERWSFPALITEIAPRGMESVSVSAVNYSPHIYLDDDNTPPAS